MLFFGKVSVILSATCESEEFLGSVEPTSVEFSRGYRNRRRKSEVHDNLELGGSSDSKPIRDVPAGC